jgi:hypothetical protein
MNFRFAIAFSVFAIFASVSGCGPKLGTASSPVRNYQGPGVADAAVAAYRWWSVTLDYRTLAFVADITDTNFAGTTFHWSGSLEPLPASGMIRLKVSSCGTDTQCAVGREIYAYEIAEVLLQISDPVDLKRATTLIAPQDCAGVSTSSLQIVGSVFGNGVASSGQAMIGTASLSAGVLKAQFTGTVYRANFSPTPGLNPNSGVSVPPGGATELDCSGKVMTSSATTVVGNATTGLYAGLFAGGPQFGWVGMSDASSLGGSDLNGLAMLYFGYASGSSCSGGAIPAVQSSFLAGRLTFNSTSTFISTDICDLTAMTATGTGAQGSFQSPSGGVIEVNPNGNYYSVYGYMRRVGNRVAAITLEDNALAASGPKAYYRLIVTE